MRKFALALTTSVCLLAASVTAFAAPSPEVGDDVTCKVTTADGSVVFTLDEDGDFVYYGEDGHVYAIEFRAMDNADADVVAVKGGDLTAVKEGVDGAKLAGEGWTVDTCYDVVYTIDGVDTKLEGAVDLSIPGKYDAKASYDVIHKMDATKWEECTAKADASYVYATVNGLSPVVVLKQVSDSKPTGVAPVAGVATVSALAVLGGAGVVVTSRRKRA